MWWMYALGSALFAALTAVFAKKGIKNIDTDLAVAFRTTVILFLAWGIAWAKGGIQQIGVLTKLNMFFLTLSGITTGLSWIFYFKALDLGKVSQVAPVDKLSLALTIIFSVIFLGEALTWRTALGASLIIVGSIITIS